MLICLYDFGTLYFVFQGVSHHMLKNDGHGGKSLYFQFLQQMEVLGTQ